MDDQCEARRATDKLPHMRENDEEWNPHAEISSHKMLYVMHLDLQSIKSDIKNMREVLSAWDNAKGFVKIVRISGEVAKWFVAVGMAFAAIWYVITRR